MLRRQLAEFSGKTLRISVATGIRISAKGKWAILLSMNYGSSKSVCAISIESDAKSSIETSS